MIIGDGIVLGSGGETASIFVTGLSETDSVSATHKIPGKVLNPEWKVPDGYTQLEYIESTGTQYIVTGLNSTTRYDHEITFSDYTYTTKAGILGSSNYYYSYTGYNNTLRWCMSDRAYDTPGSLTSKRTAKLGYNYLTVDGSPVSQISDTNGTPSDTTHTLFKGYNCASVKIYSYRASLDGQLLRDFVPCKRNSDDELGMYDLVNDVFYPNAGTGAFTAGAEIPQYIDGYVDGKTIIGKWVSKPNPVSHGLPDGYTELEYIESTGTQYIDTGYIPNPNTAMEAELLMSGTFKNVSDYGGNAGFFNVVDGESQYGMNFGGGSNQGNEVFVWLNKINGTSGTEIQSFTITNTIRTNRNKLVVGKGSISWGTASRSVTAKTTTQTTSLVLFGSKKDGVVSAFTSYNMRVFAWKISESDNVVRDFVPCKRNSDSAIGLYDLVSGSFFANSGTGTFTAGAEIPSYLYGFEIAPIKSYGTWTVTATDGTKTATQDVFVDFAVQYDIEINYMMWLYKDGNQYEDATGGWQCWKLAGTSELLETSIHIASSENNQWQDTSTKMKIDLTNFSNAKAEVKIESQMMAQYCGLGLRICNDVNTSTSTDPYLVRREYASDIGTHIITVDISDLNGEYYIALEGYYVGSAYIYKVWLE